MLGGGHAGTRSPPNPLGKCRREAPSPLRKPRIQATFLPPFSTRAGGLKDEGHRRTRGAVEVTRPRPPRGRTPQHHSNSRECADQGGQIEARLQGNRPRPGGHGDHRGGGWPWRRDHGPRAHVLRNRAQAPRGGADRARGLGRPGGAGDPRRTLPLYAADAARERLPRSCGR